LCHIYLKIPATAYAGAGYGTTRMPPNLSAAQLQKATITGKIPAIVLDSEVSSSCVKPPREEMQVSECGEYEWDAQFTATRKMLNESVLNGAGPTGRGRAVIESSALPLQTKATQAHTVPSLQNNLVRVNQMVLQ
jgi:hypothetical protein